jgi:hypothetical protein
MFNRTKHMYQAMPAAGRPWSAYVCFALVTLVIDLNAEGAGP